MSATAPSVIPARIDVISDAICPWCYIAKRNLEGALAILASEGLHFEAAWHAYQLNPDIPEAGADRTIYRIRKFGSAERAREIDARVASAAAVVGLPFRIDRIARTPNTVAAHRVVWFAGQQSASRQNAVVEALFRGYFIDGADIGNPETLADLAGEAGMNRSDILTMLAGADGRAEVLAEDSAARLAGLDGVPTFVLAGHILFSGSMPAADMADAFRRAWNVLNRQAA